MNDTGKIENLEDIPYIDKLLYPLNQGNIMRAVLLITLSLIILSLSFAGEPQLFRLDASHSLVGFNIKYMKIVGVEGRFNVVQGAFLIDTTDIAKTSFTVIIDAKSINTANEGRDEDLRGDSFFDVENNSTITFQSKKIERQGDGYIATGSFTMRGVTKEIILPFKHLGTIIDPRGNVRVGFESQASLLRSEYNVKGSTMTVDDEVHINLTALTVKQGSDTLRMMGFGGKKNIGTAMNETMNATSLKDAIEQYKTLKAAQDTTYDFGANQLNTLSKYLADRGKAKEAIEIAKLNLEVFPNEAVQYFLLGYAYQKDGQKEPAREQYKKALEIDKLNASAMEMLRWVE
ncbi:MAG: hypothetical protein EPO24_01785 [Bacteroidetes bacterium]|nr:MAG: hypothetical protein EPO24_01785 [Bacteroidota bacterium]